MVQTAVYRTSDLSANRKRHGIYLPNLIRKTVWKKKLKCYYKSKPRIKKKNKKVVNNDLVVVRHTLSIHTACTVNSKQYILYYNYIIGNNVFTRSIYATGNHSFKSRHWGVHLHSVAGLHLTKLLLLLI